MGQPHAPRTLRPTPRAMEAAGHVQMEYVASSHLSRWLATSGSYPLAILSFGAPVSQSVVCPIVALDLPQLDGCSQVEVWSSDQPVTVHRTTHFSAAMSGDILAGVLCLDDQPGVGLEEMTREAYRHLLAQLRQLGFPHLWRIWNFFPRINELEDGLERYKRFCTGRYQALAENLSDFPRSLPAGTAIGTRSGPLQIYVLAGVQPATHLGNPRQINAYDYPSTYGPRSPSFARATIRRSETGSQLFIAGTASIVGHASQHAGMPREQTRETLHNLRTLLEHADSYLNGPSDSDSRSSGLFKVYVRDPVHLSSIRASLQDQFLDTSRLLFLQGDLCRQELLVEIEGLITSD